jgi:hypothetical protein
MALASAALVIGLSANAADLVWIGGTGNWNTAGNWDHGQVPTAADNAWITNNGPYTVTVPAGTSATCSSLTVGATSGTQILAVDRSTLTLGAASLINPNGQLDLLVSQSVLNGAGNLTINGTLNWANGTISGTGIASIGTAGALIMGSGGLTLGRVLDNAGVGTWSGGNLTISVGNSINNLAGGTFDITADGRLSGTATTPINNSGLFRLTAGTAGTTVTAPFNNSGKLHVLATTLNLNLGGTHTGTMSNAVGVTLNFGGGSHSLAAGSLVTGSGTLSLSGGATLTASGTIGSGATLSVASGVATLSASCDVTGAALAITGGGGILNFNSAGPVLTMNVAAGTLGGTSPVTVSGPLTLSGGTITNALVTANGGMSMHGNFSLNGTKLVNPAAALWSAGNWTGANGAVFSNLLGATFINSFDGNMATGGGAAPQFVNAGLFQKTNGTAAAGATSIDFTFINTGTVEVQTNTLRYSINQQTAGLTLLDGGDLAAQAQPIQMLGGVLKGNGPITLANAQTLINSAVVSPGLLLGRLDITGNYQQTLTGTLDIELGGYAGGTEYDLVTVTAGGAGGAATLGGTLNVTLANGFSPTNGATFTFLTAGTRAGAFATFNYPSNDIGMQVSYDATSARITISNLKPVVANPIVDPAPLTYGGAFNYQFPANTFVDPDGDQLAYTAQGLPPGVTFTGSTRTFAGTPTQAVSFPVTVIANDGGLPNLTATNVFNITINPASLAVTAQPATKVYGAADPLLTYTLSGLQLSDTAASVLTGALTRGAGESVASSPYAIMQGTLAANGNYTINFTGSGLTITPAALSVTADAKSKTYGAADPAFTATFIGFVNGENPTALGGPLSFARAPGQNVGDYLITPGGLTSSNYVISFNPGILSITKTPLAVTADAKTKTYGAVDPVFTASYSGLVNGETPAVLSGTLTFARAPGENVGSYLINPSSLSSGNYAITFNSGSLSIMAAPLSVTAEAKTKTYGATDPLFTATYAGFVNGDAPSVLGGTLSFTRTPGEIVGDYPITPSGVTSTNYSISFNTGILSITRAPFSVTADAKTKTYGAADPVFTATYNGFVNGETPAVLGGTLTFSRVPGENVSSYLITPSGLTSGNYTITFNTGSLTITEAALSVTADAKTKAYGAADPAFTVTYAGFVNSETPAVLGGTLAFTRAPGENVGNYPITPGGLTSGNYLINFDPGTLSITKAALSVTADDKTKTYGVADPAFTATYLGFVNGETPTVLGGTLVFGRGPGESAGTYPITASGLTSSNYSITFNGGTLTIAKAQLSVTADDKAKTYGTVDPVFTASYAGLVNGETPAVLAGTLTFTRTTGENLGNYRITPSGLTSADYAIAFNSGTLTIIAPAPVIFSVTPTTTNVVISWTSVSNATYRVQYVPALGLTNWANLAGDVVAVGSTAARPDVLTTTNRFYRVRVVP